MSGHLPASCWIMQVWIPQEQNRVLSNPFVVVDVAVVIQNLFVLEHVLYAAIQATYNQLVLSDAIAIVAFNQATLLVLAPPHIQFADQTLTAAMQVANLATEVLGLIMVSSAINGVSCPFVIDTGADISLLPLET